MVEERASETRRGICSSRVTSERSGSIRLRIHVGNSLVCTVDVYPVFHNYLP